MTRRRNGSVLRTVGLAAPLAAVAVIGLAATAAAQEAVAPVDVPVTFTRDVAPILQRSCLSCHRPGSIAPMSLVTYGEARPWARSIKQRVAQREMPPWYVERNIGIQQFEDDPSLTDEEIATIV